jgi:hypothetical protein
MFLPAFLSERVAIRKSLKISMAEGVGFEPTDPEVLVEATLTESQLVIICD